MDSTGSSSCSVTEPQPKRIRDPGRWIAEVNSSISMDSFVQLNLRLSVTSVKSFWSHCREVRYLLALNVQFSSFLKCEKSLISYLTPPTLQAATAKHSCCTIVCAAAVIFPPQHTKYSNITNVIIVVVYLTFSPSDLNPRRASEHGKKRQGSVVLCV